jgi:hypothetical protein
MNMKKYIISAVIVLFFAGTYYVSGHYAPFSSLELQDTVISGKSGVSNEEVLPVMKNTEHPDSTDCPSRCKSKCGSREVPVGESPDTNIPDTITNIIKPQEEKQ